jgi:ATPase subunit of ABC transporter with duplicated ATPase domains
MIAILRALAPRPRLLLLDEPTNHLDLTATRGVLDALATWPDRPGIVLVSHDPAAMAGLDAVYRIDAARLREVCPTDT